MAVEMLPRDTATSKKLFKIMLLLLERDRQHANCDPLTALLPQNLESRVAEALLDAASVPEQERSSPKICELATASRQLA